MTPHSPDPESTQPPQPPRPDAGRGQPGGRPGGGELPATRLPLGQPGPAPAPRAGTVAGGPDGSTLLMTQGQGEREAPQPTSVRGQRLGERGRFELVRTLGEGGMGTVYEALDREVEQRTVALKVIRERYSADPRFRELFFKEISAAEKFVSEYVTQVRNSGQLEDGRLFMTMDLVDGRPLDDLLRQEGTLGVRHALEIARQVLLGLQSGHKRGFVHRDVKPSNVMLERRVAKTEENPFGVGVKLLDFGIAGNAAHLRTGEQIGTPYYMSPEQVRGEPVDGRSDLFAVGVMLFELLAGGPPFTGKTVRDITEAVLETDVQPMLQELEHIAKPVREIVSKALAKDREQRFQSAGDFIKAIERSRAYKPKVSAPGWLVGGVAAMGLAVIGISAYFLSQINRLTDENRTVHRNWEDAKEEIAIIRPKAERVTTVEAQLSSMTDKGAYDALVVAKQTADDNLNESRQRVEELLGELEQLRAEASSRALSAEAREAELSRRLEALSAGPQRALGVVHEAIRLVNAGDYAGARAELLRVLDDATLLGEVAAGGRAEFVAAAALCGGLAAYRSQVALDFTDPQAVRQALADLAQSVLVLDGGRESFASRVAWITEGKKSNTALPDVVAVAAFLFGSAGEPGLLGKARAQLAEHDAAREQERAALAAAGFEGGLLIEFPRLLRFARRFAEEADQQFVDAQLERWTADLEASLALDGGRLLDLARLSALPSLQDRIDWVGTRPALAAQPPRGRLQRLEAARLLHVEGAVERARSLALAAGLGSAESGGPGWVELLELHLSLLRTGGPLPLGGSQKSYFRVQHSPTATTIEEWSPKADGAGRTAVNAFDLSRRVGSDRVLQLQGRVLYLDNDALVELGQLGAGQRVERWKPPTQGGDLSLLPAAAQDRLRALQEGPGARCLVIERASGREVWLSPELGIVKMPAAGGILYELLSALL